MTRRARAAALLVVAGALTGLGIMAWQALDRLDRPARWLTIEAPAHAVAGEPYPVRVTVRNLPAPTYVVADFHWSDRQRASHGYYLKGSSEWIAEPQGSWSFAISVDRRSDLAFIMAVIYLTPTGDWKDRSRVARTRLIEVKAGSGSPASPRWVEIAAYEGRPAEPDHATTVASIALAALLALCSLLAAAAGARSQQRRGWAVLAAAALAAAAWELSGAAAAATQLGRSVAEEQNWYALRQPLQKALVVALGTGGIAFVIAALRSGRSFSRSLRVALVGMTGYALLAAVDLLSLHAIDTLGHRALGPGSVMQALKAAAAALTLLAAAAELSVRSSLVRPRPRRSDRP